MSPEEWQVRIDGEFPDGVRVEHLVDGWAEDPTNIIMFAPRVIVETTSTDGWPYLRVTDIYTGNGTHWFTTVGESPTHYGILFELEDGSLWLTAFLPPQIKADIDEVARQQLVEYSETPTAEQTA